MNKTKKYLLLAGVAILFAAPFLRADDPPTIPIVIPDYPPLTPAPIPPPEPPNWPIPGQES